MKNSIGNKIRSFYELRQDVNYPLYLAYWWGRNPAYAPGGVVENGVDWGAIYPNLWRQCWNFMGSISIDNLK